MATEWYIEGPWYKTCSCDPGCPCDFNQRPTKGTCEALIAFRVDKGNFGDVDLAGVIWGGLAKWPGPLHEGNGEIQPFVNDSASDDQRSAVFEILSGKHGDSMMEVFAYVAPTVHEPIVAPIDFEFDLESRSGRVKVGDVAELEVETLRGIDPPDPYRVIVKIPDGMEYTNEEESAETAVAKRIMANGAIKFDITDGHVSMCFARHGNAFRTGKHEPTIVEKAFG
jgi:hypothetical protein